MTIDELLDYEPLLPHQPEIQIEANLLPGCLSRVWLVKRDGRWLADSDSKINRAVIYLLLTGTDGKELPYLGRSRANGMHRLYLRLREDDHEPA
jgi:sulfur transfer protein SufE